MYIYHLLLFAIFINSSCSIISADASQNKKRKAEAPLEIIIKANAHDPESGLAGAGRSSKKPTPGILKISSEETPYDMALSYITKIQEDISKGKPKADIESARGALFSIMQDFDISDFDALFDACIFANSVETPEIPAEYERRKVVATPALSIIDRPMHKENIRPARELIVTLEAYMDALHDTHLDKIVKTPKKPFDKANLMRQRKALLLFQTLQKHAPDKYAAGPTMLEVNTPGYVAQLHKLQQGCLRGAGSSAPSGPAPLQ